MNAYAATAPAAADQDHRQDQIGRRGAVVDRAAGIGGSRGDGRGGDGLSGEDGRVAVGRADRGARPVVLPQRRFDGGPRHLVELALGEGASGSAE